MIIAYAVLVYLSIVWIIIPIAVPHFGFREEKLPGSMPEHLKTIIETLDGESNDNMDFLRKSYHLITSMYQGSRVKTVTQFWVAFENPLDRESGFMPCTGQNYLLRLMLVESGRFTDADVQTRIVPVNFFIHQYLLVRIDGAWIAADPWAAFLGVPLGERAPLIG